MGVISEPDIVFHELNLDSNSHVQDRFLVIGSDGLFEVLSNEEVINIVGRVYDEFLWAQSRIHLQNGTDGADGADGADTGFCFEIRSEPYV